MSPQNPEIFWQLLKWTGSAADYYDSAHAVELPRSGKTKAVRYQITQSRPAMTQPHPLLLLTPGARTYSPRPAPSSLWAFSGCPFHLHTCTEVLKRHCPRMSAQQQMAFGVVPAPVPLPSGVIILGHCFPQALRIPQQDGSPLPVVIICLLLRVLDAKVPPFLTSPFLFQVFPGSLPR